MLLRRISDRISDFFLRQNEAKLRRSKGKNLLIRLVMLSLVALVFAKIAPTLADEISNPPVLESPAPIASSAPSSVPTESPAPEPTAAPEATPTPTLIPVPASPSSPAPISVPSDSTSPSERPSASPSAKPTPHPLANQTLRIAVPNSVPVDPRGSSVYLPQINVSGTQYLEVCATSTTVIFDTYSKNSYDSAFNGSILVAGDLTSSLLITGTIPQVLAILNSDQGLRLINPARPIGGSSALIRFVAISEPVLNPAFCAAAAPANSKLVEVRAMGLGMDLIKGTIVLKK